MISVVCIGIRIRHAGANSWLIEPKRYYVRLLDYGTIAPNFVFSISSTGKHMRLHRHTPLSSFALGLVSLFGTSICIVNLSDLAIAQSFPTNSTASTTQYLVYLPNVSSLRSAKAIAPDAFTSRLDTGEQVVQLGRFNNLNLAQKRVNQFSQAGLPARIITVQSKFGGFPSPPVSSIPPIPNNFPPSSVPIPVESIPIPNSRVFDPLPGVPGSDFPNNSIEIVRSPQPLPPLGQSFPSTNPTVAVQSSPTGMQLRYFVIIPTGIVSELQRVQAIAPNAQLRSSFRGTYIEVQGYPDRPSAETLNLTIRRQGFDSRVVFF